MDVIGSTNRELFASMKSGMMDRFQQNKALEKDAELQKMMNTVADACTEYKAGDHIMTDDKAPVELLGMQVIDEMIRDEVRYYKQIYEEQGLEGLLNSL